MAAPIDIKDASHILFRTLTQFKNKYNNDYNSLVNGLFNYINTVPGGAGRPRLEIKVTTLVGNSEPSNPAGQAQRFLNEFFPGMPASKRVLYFSQNYFGGQIRYQTLLEKLRTLDDGLRLKLSYTDTFIILGLTNRNAAGVYSELYHLTIGRAPSFDVQGQHGIPTGAEVLQSVHLTDETTGIHYFVKFSSFSSPLNESAGTLLASLKPGRLGGRRTIRRKKLSKKKKTLRKHK